MPQTTLDTLGASRCVMRDALRFSFLVTRSVGEAAFEERDNEKRETRNEKRELHASRILIYRLANVRKVGQLGPGV
jgi:hypothetical protein